MIFRDPFLNSCISKVLSENGMHYFLFICAFHCNTSDSSKWVISYTSLLVRNNAMLPSNLSMLQTELRTPMVRSDDAYCSWDMVSNSQSNSVLRRYYLTSQFVFSIFPYFRGCRILQNSSYTIYVLFNCHNVPYITEKHSGQSFLKPITQRPTSSLLPTGLGDQVDVQPSFCSVMYQLICWYLSS